MPPQRNGAFEVPEDKLTRIRFFFLTDVSAGSKFAFFCKSFLSHLFPYIHTAILSLSNNCSILIGCFNSHFYLLFKNQAPQKDSALRKIKKRRHKPATPTCFSPLILFLPSFSKDRISSFWNLCISGLTLLLAKCKYTSACVWLYSNYTLAKILSRSRAETSIGSHIYTLLNVYQLNTLE